MNLLQHSQFMIDGPRNQKMKTVRINQMTTFQLDLSSNRIAEIEEDNLRGLSNLNHLYLSNNSIYQVNGGVFESTPQLQELHMAHNLLIEVPPALGRLSRLKHLNLASNQIRLVTFLEKYALDELHNCLLIRKISERNALLTVALCCSALCCGITMWPVQGFRKIFEKMALCHHLANSLTSQVLFLCGVVSIFERRQSSRPLNFGRWQFFCQHDEIAMSAFMRTGCTSSRLPKSRKLHHAALDAIETQPQEDPAIYFINKMITTMFLLFYRHSLGVAQNRDGMRQHTHRGSKSVQSYLWNNVQFGGNSNCTPGWRWMTSGEAKRRSTTKKAIYQSRTMKHRVGNSAVAPFL